MTTTTYITSAFNPANFIEICKKCDGCGKVDNTKLQLPWSHYPHEEGYECLAVKLKAVKPLVCPSCHGTGEILNLKKHSSR